MQVARRLSIVILWVFCLFFGIVTEDSGVLTLMLLIGAAGTAAFLWVFADKKSDE